MTTPSDGSSQAGGPEDPAAQPPAWERDVLVTELGPSEAAVRCWQCTAVGLSRSGLTLRSKSMVHVGRILKIRVPEAGSDQLRTLHGVVTESGYQIGLGHVVAVEFCAKPARPETSDDSGG